MSTVQLLAELPSLMGVYVIALIVGGGLIVFSVVAGDSGDADAGDIDFDADWGGDVDLDAGELGDGVDLDVADGAADGFALSDWLSLRFLNYFAAMFGLTGTVLTMADDLSNTTVLGMAVIAGAIVGQVVHQMMRWLIRGSSDSATARPDYINRKARVTVSIGVGGRGEVAIRIKDGERYVPAVCKRADDQFATGAVVGVVGIEAGIATVVSQQEFDFLNERQ